MELFDQLEKYLLENSYEEIDDYILFQLDDGHVGVIYCNSYVERLDDHCDQCRDEILPLRFACEAQNISHYLSVEVGPTKFDRIKSGEKFDPFLNKIKLSRYATRKM